MKALPLVLAVVFAVVGVMYVAGIPPMQHHVKHAVLFLGLAALSLVWMRFAANADRAPSAR